MASPILRALGGAARYAEGRLTPDRFRAGGGPVGQSPLSQSLGSYLLSTAQGFDPRTPGGVASLAAMFGGKLPGARFTTPADLPTALTRGGVEPLDAAKFYGRAHASAGGSYVGRAIGPRRIGGIYKGGYGNEAYRVLDIKHGESGDWAIKVEPLEPDAPQNLMIGARWHSTPWAYGKDQVLHQPPGATPAAHSYLTQLLGQRFNPAIHKPPGG